MAVLNLRGVPDELAAQLKSEAAWIGIGFHEYCVAILERGRSGKHAVMREEREKMGPRKKIAGNVEGGGTTEGGGTPDLPPVGKAQDENVITGVELISGQEPVIIYGRPYSGAAPPGLSERAAEFGEAMLKNLRESGVRRVAALPDGVSCGHAGCLSHISHPCEGCGRIGGRRSIYNTEDNEAAQKNREGNIPDKWWMTEVVKAGGINKISGELLEKLSKEAEFNKEVAIMLHAAKYEVDREILVRWGLAENYKPKLEDVGGVKKSVAESAGGEAGASAGKNRRASKVVPKNNDGDESPAVGVGKPGVDMKALRDICAGNVSAQDIWAKPLTKEDVDAIEVDLCGFKSYNEIDGENYVCGKEKHDAKVKHGEWLKI